MTTTGRPSLRPLMLQRQQSSRYHSPNTQISANGCRTTFHDAIRGTSAIWPAAYDGRGVVTDAYRDHVGGMSLEDNIKKSKGDKTRGVTWA